MDKLIEVAIAYGPMAGGIFAVVITCLLILNRESKLRVRRVEDELDETETLRVITKEDRAYLVKAQERNELLVNKSMEMLKELSDCAGEITLLKQRLEDEIEDRQKEKELWEQFRHMDILERERERKILQEEINALKLRCTDLESQVHAKQVIIDQLREK